MCRYHLQDLEYPFSLPGITSLFRTYEHEQTTIINGREGGMFGFSLMMITGRTHMWHNNIRTGGRHKHRNLWKYLDRESRKRKRSLRVLSDAEKEAIQILARNSIQQIERKRMEIEERKVARHAQSKWGHYVDSCAVLSIGQMAEFSVGDSDPKQFRALLRGALQNAAGTRMGKWSVKQTAVGTIQVVKVGQYYTVWEHLAMLENEQAASG